MADLVYPPVIVTLKTFWKYLGLRFNSKGVENIPREGGAILAMNHIGYLDFALIGTCALPTPAVEAILKVTGDWQKHKGLPGTEGTLRVAAPKPPKSVAYEAAVKQAMDEPKEGATTLKKKAQEKLAAKANPVVEETPAPVVEEAPAVEAEAPAVVEETPAAEVVAEATPEAAAE
jgi:small subunit ribosomal protein S16